MSAERLLREAAKAASPEGVSGLRPSAVQALRDLIEDPDSPASVRAPAALGVLKLVAEEPAEDPSADRAAFLRYRRRAFELAYSLGAGRRLLGWRQPANQPTR